jgi:acetyl/propionyl-CoA carboxylase alpha subunit/acetyl-CoA carboxylase carboxyltransferase component
MKNEFRRIAILNRGEAAMRLIHAAREFSQEHAIPLCTIALFTESDRNTMFVREADEAFSLGTSHFMDPDTQLSKSAYLDYGRLEQALTATGAEAVWVGWGFVAEQPEFADLCREIGVVHIGPTGDAIRQLGNKIAAKRLAEHLQIQVVPWSGGPVETLSEAIAQGDQLGFPLLIKAAAGAAGRGIHRADSPGELRRVFESARDQAFQAFGDPTVFLERLVQRARQLEVPIIADLYGTTWAAGVRECTVQRRWQKILEEAPCPALSAAQNKALCEASVRISKAAGYSSTGAAEFLYRPEDERFWFLEVNPCLQAGHPVTECTTGLDLVKLQLHIARGGRLERKPPRSTGYAVAVQLNAEDSDHGLTVTPGLVTRFRMAMGPGIRADTGVAEGDLLTQDFDSKMATVIGYGRSRSEALARLRCALRDSVIVIQGGTSNRPFLLETLDRRESEDGQVDVEWLDRMLARNGDPARRYADVALVQAAIDNYTAEFAVEQARFYASATRGRPHVLDEIGRTLALRYGGHSYSARIRRTGSQDYRLELDGTRINAHIERRDQFECWLTVFGHRFHVVSSVEGMNSRIDVDGVSHRVTSDDWGMVHAPGPAVVVSIAVKPGDMVAAGDPLVVLEAMKMETQVAAPFPGKVRQIVTMANVQVGAGSPLVQIEVAGGADAITTQDRVVLGASQIPGIGGDALPTSGRQSLLELRQLMLGFDLDPAATVRQLAAWTESSPADGEEIRNCENEILNIFVDICALFHREPELNQDTLGEEPSAEAYFFSYLRMVETNGEGLPPAFVDALRRALAHYGVKSLDGSPQLKENLLWICKSHQRMEKQTGAILNILQRRLPENVPSEPGTNGSFRALLDRMIAITRDLYPSVSDLAREVRYRYFDLPVFERARAQVYDAAEENLAYVAAHPDAPDQHTRMHALIECPELLAGLFGGRFAAADPALRQIMLEVLTCRYYRIRTLQNLRSASADGQAYVTAEYDFEGKTIHVIATFAEYSALGVATQALFPVIAAVPAGHDVVMDFHLSKPGKLDDPDVEQRDVLTILSQIAFPRPLRRMVTAIAGVCPGERLSAVHHFTYRAAENGYEEDALYRGVHPMMGKRLHLWRLGNFKLERLPSADDVYLVHAIARDNAKDERLFAAAEVRDVTPVRDEDGHVVQLPDLERMLMKALAAIRLFQSGRVPNERLWWNRVFLYVWPALNLRPDELHDIVRRLAPATEGLGLEQVVVRARIPNPSTGELRDMVVRVSSPAESGLLITFRPADKVLPLKSLSPYDQKVVRLRRRGLVYPYEIVKMLTPAMEDTRAEFPPGEFVEYDLDAAGRLVAVDRPYGQNQANIIVGVIRNFTTRYPEGMTRVLLLGDPSRDLGALAEPECRRIMAGLDLAAKKSVPVEWFPISAGAKISMESGVENMDWIAQVLRRLVEFTQAGGEVNLLINGINVGAQPYWNAEATMLMHTRGILVMTPKAAMVLTGKRALDYSGSVSAEDNLGIGGYDRIMGVNGQAQYWARDMNDACHILFRHYEHTYVLSGEPFPRRAATGDPIDRDIGDYPHYENGGEGFARIGEIMSDETNPGRKKPFDIRRVMMAAIDQDHPPLERWGGMRAADTAVVWDAHLGGYPVCLIGFESHAVPRMGFIPADGPDQWSAGTLFPQSSKKVARAINSASDNRPLVVLANLSGFDGSPESMRRLQLEYGAEIGRAVINFKGPMVFCVISRYHGGAYVVFSRALNEQLEVAALEGTYASVIGGAPAAAVVFTGEVDARTRQDERLQSLDKAIVDSGGAEKGKLRAQRNDLYQFVYSEKLGEIAGEFDRVHSVHRALRVGALDHIIPPAGLRPYLVSALERGMKGGKKATPALEVMRVA